PPASPPRCRVATPWVDAMAAHDLQETGVIGEAERAGRLRDVPIVALQSCHDDLALGLCLESLEAGGRLAAPEPGRRRGSRPVADVGGHVVDADRVAVRGN